MNTITDDEELSMEAVAAAVFSGQVSFAGADEESEALLRDMKRAFRAGVLYGTDFVDGNTDSVELDAAFGVFIVSEIL